MADETPVLYLAVYGVEKLTRWQEFMYELDGEGFTIYLTRTYLGAQLV